MSEHKWNLDKLNEWDQYFIKMAIHVASKSKDTSTQVGCVIVGPDNEVLSTGYNGFCRGIKYTPERLARPAKYLWTEHAERNAVYNAVRRGISLKDSTAYVVAISSKPMGIVPCMDCARALLQSGVTTIVEPTFHMNGESEGKLPAWAESQEAAEIMLKEAGVRLRLVTYER